MSISPAIRLEYGKMDVLAQMMEAHMMKNATVALNQEEYNAEAQRIEERCNAAMTRAAALEGELGDRKRRSKEIRAFMMMLSTQPRVLMEWDERVWITLLDTVTVQADGLIAFRFKCGTVING